MIKIFAGMRSASTHFHLAITTSPEQMMPTSP